MSQPEQNGVSPQDLLLMIGELIVENRLLRERLATLERAAQETATKQEEEVHAGH